MSQYPSAVTVAMVRTYLAGRASANAFAAASHVGIRVVDAGVAAELPPHPNLIDAKIRMGTAQRRARAGDVGRSRRVTHWQKAARSRWPRSTPAPTSSRSAKWASATPPPPRCWCTAWRRRRSMTASGSGLGRTMRAWRASAPPLPGRPRAAMPVLPLDVLSEFGGLEIAMMAGAVLGAASRRRPVVIDGFISSCGGAGGDPALSGGAGLLRVRASLRRKRP